MEKLTISLIAVLHGEDEVISEAMTVEAESREELMAGAADALRGLADDIKEAAGL